MIFKNKRGVILDLGFIIQIFFFFLLVFGISFLIWTYIQSAFTSLDIIAGDVETIAQIEKVGQIYDFLDKFLLF